jgi:tRNA modification GTPase
LLSISKYLVIPNVKKLLNSIETHLNDNRKGERLRDGANIIVIGPPNAGKSSLLNALGI